MKNTKYLIAKCTTSTRIGREVFGDICKNVYHVDHLASYKKNFDEQDIKELLSRDMKVLTKEYEPNYGSFVVEFSNGKYVKFGAAEWFHMIPLKDADVVKVEQ